MRLDLTPKAREALTLEEEATIFYRAKDLGAIVRAGYSYRNRYWAVTARVDNRPIFSLTGYGPLAAVLAGLLDDVEAAA